MTDSAANATRKTFMVKDLGVIKDAREPESLVR
jgi:hypothetical protein